MQKQMYQNIKLYARNTLVVVNDSRQAKLTALDLVTLVGGDTNPKRFVRIPDEQMKVFQKKISEKYLAYSLEYGIGFVYEGMPEKDRQIVEELFKIDGISVLICTYQLRWQISLKAFMVVVLDPARYDGRDHRWADYSIPDMLHIMSWATTSEKDRKKSKDHFAAKFYILCVTSKKEFYKKFLSEPYPVESSLNLYLANHMNA
jgi:replicative superfamily II helicase